RALAADQAISGRPWLEPAPALGRQSQFLCVSLHRLKHECHVLPQLDPQLGGTLLNVSPVHSGSESLRLELLLHTGQAQLPDIPVRPNQNSRSYQSGDLVAGEQRARESGVALNT